MVELMVIALFAISLFLCVGLNISVLAALVFGFVLFFAYGLYKKHSAREMAAFAVSGIKTVRNVLFNFVLIGMITAVWRSSGTIAYIVYHATRFCSPHGMVLITFWLCCLISFLTGTAFGTAATMGVICVTMANSMGIPLLYSGGAVMSGAYFGDRYSPMSTSAMLISTLTRTDQFKNLTAMFRTAVIPFILTCCVYVVMGMGFDASCDVSGMREIFADAFVMHPAVIIPALLVLVLSLFRINVKITMGVSILCGVAIAIGIQKLAPMEMLKIAVFGYTPENEAIRAALSGGGILSMVKVFCIVCISSSYSGMFNGTGLLDGLRQAMCRLSRKITPFGGVLAASVLTGLIACNQTLTIMLTDQLCEETDDAEHMALYLEDTAVVISALTPWSIACVVPLSSVGAPAACVLTSCFLYLLPLCSCIKSVINRPPKSCFA